MYVAYNDTTNSDVEVLRFKPGKTTGANLGIHIKPGYAGGLAFDKADNLVLANQSTSEVDIFAPGATTPTQQIGGFAVAYQLTLNRKNNHLYVSSGYSASVAEDSYPAGTSIQTITDSLSGAFGVATSPDNPY